MELSDAQWDKIAALFPNDNFRSQKRGRPKRKTRQVLAGVIWFLTHQATWRELPHYFPPYQTCHRWFSKWCQEKIMLELINLLDITLSEERQAEIKSLAEDRPKKINTILPKLPTQPLLREKVLSGNRLSLINCFNTGNLDKYLGI